MAAPSATLRQLHLHYVAGRYEHAANLGESMLGRSGSSRWRGRVHYYTAMAYFQLGRPEDGAMLLGEARKHADELGEPAMVIECMAADAALALLRQAPDAVEIANAALPLAAACRACPASLRRGF